MTSAGVELTSVTSYINRDILVSRDASALTGSVSVSPLGGLSGSAALALLAVQPAGHDRAQTRKRRNFVSPRRATGRSSGCSAASTATSTATMHSACRPPAMTRSSMRRLGAGVSGSGRQRLRLAGQLPYNADLPYVHQAEGAVRRGELQVRPVQAHRRRPLLRLQGNARLHLGRHLLERRHGASATRRSRTASARADRSAGSRTATSASTSRSPRASVSAASTIR